MPDDKDSRSRHTSKKLTSGFILVAALFFIIVVGLLGTVLAWTRSTKTTLVVRFTQSGQLNYSARPGPNSVYGSGGLKTGQPIYLNSVDHLTVSYSYALRSASPSRVGGTEQLMATINNGEGVTRSIALQPRTAFHGAGFATPVTFRLSRLAHIAKTFEKGGPTTGLYSVTLSPSVKVDGTLAGRHLSTGFNQPVHFVFGNGMLAPTASAGVPAPGSKVTATLPPSSPDFNPTTSGKMVVAGGKTATLAGLSVRILRFASPVLVALAAVAAALAIRQLIQLLFSLDERGRIALRHHSAIVEIETLPSDSRLIVVGLSSFGSALRIARQLECPILHLHNALGDDYVVIDNGTVYRYHVGSERPGRVGRLVMSPRENGRHAVRPPDHNPTRAMSAGD